MIYFGFNISRRKGDCETIKHKHGQLFKYKYWEIETAKTRSVIHFQFHMTWKKDHAGLQLEFGLLNREILFTIYDCRHWNDQTNSWAEHDTSENNPPL